MGWDLCHVWHKQALHAKQDTGFSVFMCCKKAVNTFVSFVVKREIPPEIPLPRAAVAVKSNAWTRARVPRTFAGEWKLEH